MSRRGCVEKIQILPDGTIPPVEMTSLGFEDSLLPYRITPAEYACVLKNGPYVTEKNEFTRVITNIQDESVLGYKYFDFGEDDSSKTMEFAAEVVGLGKEDKVVVFKYKAKKNYRRKQGHRQPFTALKIVSVK